MLPMLTKNEPTPRQRRLLRRMQDGNPIFEVVGKPYCTLYNEKLDRDQRVRQEEVQKLEAAGWIRSAPNPSRTRLDSWEITDDGRSVLLSER
jgi:hypothetical protein